MSDDQYGDDAEVLEISEDAVRTWATAWREFADAVRGQAEWAQMQSGSGDSWGDLESIRYLEKVYRDHLGGGKADSFSSRIRQFSDEAERIAERLEKQFQALTEQDLLAAKALEGGGQWRQGR